MFSGCILRFEGEDKWAESGREGGEGRSEGEVRVFYEPLSWQRRWRVRPASAIRSRISAPEQAVSSSTDAHPTRLRVEDPSRETRPRQLVADSTCRSMPGSHYAPVLRLQNPASSAPAPTTWEPSGTTVIPSRLPEALPLHDDQLCTQLTTHMSWFHSQPIDRPLLRRSTETSCYRPLEWLGDGVIKGVVVRGLYKMFPEETVRTYSVSRGPRNEETSLADPLGRQTLSSRLVRNNTLGYLGWAYGFHHHLRTGGQWAGDGRLEEQQDTLADMFEAYVGALTLEYGDQKTEQWLRRVYTVEVFPNLDQERKQLRENDVSASDRKRKAAASLGTSTLPHSRTTVDLSSRCS